MQHSLNFGLRLPKALDVGMQDYSLKRVAAHPKTKRKTAKSYTKASTSQTLPAEKLWQISVESRAMPALASSDGVMAMIASEQRANDMPEFHILT